MISARLRYVALALAAVVFAAMAALYAQAGVWLGLGANAVLCMVCGEGAAYVRRAAARLQRLEQQARPAFDIEEPWLTWCCEFGWVSRGDVHMPDTCTQRQEHP
ncbi:hypothetical protein [Streptomyces sp. NPDC056707]|uniref:hypothetical protein n=1 Tax=Streptomyces sp. NPDC056707 TaxID=3345919 RepID=UPI00369B880E